MALWGLKTRLRLRSTKSDTNFAKIGLSRTFSLLPPTSYDDGDDTSADSASLDGDSQTAAAASATSAGGDEKTAPTSSANCPPVKISVYTYTYDPTIAWDLLRSHQPVKTVKPMKLDSPRREDCIRFVAISDLHGNACKTQWIPDGDVLLCAGDFTSCGHPHEIRKFDRFLGDLPHRYKVVICGNHELTFDPLIKKSNYMVDDGNNVDYVFLCLHWAVGFERLFKAFEKSPDAIQRQTIQESLNADNIDDVRQLLTNCIYLEDSSVEIYGIKIYGSPWQPTKDNWAFNLPRGQALLDKWNLIPAGVDILLTHTPPLGHGDLSRTRVRSGCVELLNSVRKRIRPKYHVFGHIHEGYGCTTDGYTKFLNASMCDSSEPPKLTNPPIIFDYPLSQPELRS